MEKQPRMESPDQHLKDTRSLALFDFDGTVTRKDTLIRFILFTHGRLRFVLSMLWLFPFLAAYKLNLYSNEKAKQRMLAWFYKGWNYAEFKRKGEEFGRNILPSLIRRTALEKISWHLKKNHRVLLVSASVEEWVRPWCDLTGIECVCTRMEVKDNRITGKLSTRNCYGPEKVNRVKNTLSLGSYDTIYAYGDTKGDREMLAIASKPYFRHFDD